MKKLSCYILLFFVVFSCKKDEKIAKEITDINVEFEVERFDKFFIGPESKDLSKLKEVYPFLFSKRYPDSIWMARRNDTLQQHLHAEVESVFQSHEFDDITLLFKHLKHHVKAFKIPRVITTTSDVDYRNKVIVTDSITLIALDTYLGENHEFYSNIQQYIKQNFRQEMIVSDLAEAYAKNYMYQSSQKSFLDNMIYFGKMLYFKDEVIPFVSDADKMGYTQQQLNWAEANESNIWQYFIENELLFSSEPKLATRFINPAPFSKFNLEFEVSLFNSR